ncbi:MAG: hypothetical protein IJ639_06555 [Ruminococcus sp.]|nr:hypothetical protein [Ruminococcus sp.]
MNKVNFDSLKNIKAPDSWLEKAALIPETPVKRHAAFSVYRFVAAASVVLVSVLGVAVFTHFDNGKAPIGLKGGTDASVYPSLQAVGETTDAIIPTDPAIVSTVTAAQPTAGVQPTVSPTAPTSVQSGTENPAPTVHPNEKQIKPTESATERGVKPTEAPKETESLPPTSPPATEESTGIFPEGMPNISAAATFPFPIPVEEDIDENVIYCAIYDHGRLVSQGAASVFIMKNGNVFAEYDTGIEAERGKVYHYAFFSKHASGAGYEESPIFASGTISY